MSDLIQESEEVHGCVNKINNNLILAVSPYDKVLSPSGIRRHGS